MPGTKGHSGTSKASLANLTNINDNVSKEEKKEAGRKGGIASGKARREKRDMQKRIQDIFDMTIAGGREGKFNNLSEASGQNLSVIDACILKQVQKAMKGDTRALEFLRDTAGMKPVDKKEVKSEIHSDGKLQDILDALNSDDE